MEHAQTCTLRNRKSKDAIYCSCCGGIINSIGSYKNQMSIDMFIPYQDPSKHMSLSLIVCGNCREKIFLFMTSSIRNYISFNDFIEEEKQLNELIKPLSGRAQGVILRSGNTINDILNFSYEDLIHMKNCGKKIAREIVNRILEYKYEKNQY